MLAHRWLRSPPGWVSATNTSSSTRAPSRRRSTSAYTRTGGPKSWMAWSIMWLPRSARRPPASRGSGPSRQAPAATRGRQRSKRDSSRTGRPSAPSASNRRTVRKSPSQRRFWNTVSIRPTARGLVRQLAAVAGGRGQRLVDHHRQPRPQGRAGLGHVLPVRGGHDHQVQLPGRLPQLVRPRHQPRAGMVALRRRAAGRVGGDDRGDPHPVGGRDQRRVEDAAGEAVPEDGDAEVGGRHAGDHRSAPHAREALPLFA